MSIVLAAICLHVAMGAIWLLATLVMAILGRARTLWLRLSLGAAVTNMLAGIFLWHALHAGPWGASERVLVIGTLLAFVALGMQAPVAFAQLHDAGRLEGPSRGVYRITALLLLAAASAMIASRRSGGL